MYCTHAKISQLYKIKDLIARVSRVPFLSTVLKFYLTNLKLIWIIGTFILKHLTSFPALKCEDSERGGLCISYTGWVAPVISLRDYGSQGLVDPPSLLNIRLISTRLYKRPPPTSSLIHPRSEKRGFLSSLTKVSYETKIYNVNGIMVKI